MINVSMKAMLEAGVHFGHQTRRWNPKMSRFIFGERNGIHIIDLQKTVKEIKKVGQWVQDQAATGKTFLFVGTKKQAQDLLKAEADRCGASYVCEKWLGGTLTNFATLRKSVKRLEELEKWQNDGIFAILPKKEVARLNKEMAKLKKNLSGLRGLDKLPDIMFIVNPVEEDLSVQEARKLNIPIVAVCDTDCDPDLIDHPIPGNDDAARSIKLFCALIADAVVGGKQQFEAAKLAQSVAGAEAAMLAEGAAAETEQQQTADIVYAPTEETTTPQEVRQDPMPTIDSTQLVKDLREKTGAGMMDCKRALDEAKGDFNEALTVLRKKGMADAAKKSTRATKEGAVAFKIEGKAGAIIEINSETDFVAKGADFQALVKTLAEKACAGSLKSAEAATEEFVKPLIGKLGENMALRRFDRFELKGAGLIAGYAHQTDMAVPAKNGALIELSAPNDAAAQSPALAELAKDLLLQIVGAMPKYLVRSEIPAADIEKEKEIHTDILRKEGKPEASIPKIIEGKINKLFYQQWVLLDQVLLRDNKQTVSGLVAAASAKLGGEVKVVRFVRYQLGS